MSAESISNGLRTSLIGRKVLYADHMTSTMDVARQEAKRGAQEGTVVVAGRQEAGRGRLKREWLSPEGNVALSVILHPPLVYLPRLVMLASVAVARTIERVAGPETQIKWPNDVLVKGKKLCGILVESDVRGDRVAYAIIGIGINVRLDPAAFPEISSTATSVSAEAGRDMSRLALIRELLCQVDKLYLASPGGEAVFEEWKRRLFTLGKRVRVTAGGGILEGIAESVENDGTLLLRLPDGSLSRVIAGDVTLRDSG